jgi:hypothetical protein
MLVIWHAGFQMSFLVNFFKNPKSAVPPWEKEAAREQESADTESLR